MGDDTTEFASRFSLAVDRLAAIGRETGEAVRGPEGERLAAAVRDALDAVKAVYRTRTEGVRNWPEQRRRTLAALEEMRERLDRTGVDREVRRMARALVEIIEPAPAGE